MTVVMTGLTSFKMSICVLYMHHVILRTCFIISVLKSLCINFFFFFFFFAARV